MVKKLIFFFLSCKYKKKTIRKYIYIYVETAMLYRIEFYGELICELSRRLT